MLLPPSKSPSPGQLMTSRSENNSSPSCSTGRGPCPQCLHNKSAMSDRPMQLARSRSLHTSWPAGMTPIGSSIGTGVTAVHCDKQQLRHILAIIGRSLLSIKSFNSIVFTVSLWKVLFNVDGGKSECSETQFIRALSADIIAFYS